MKQRFAILVIALGLAPLTAQAVDDPHGSTNSIDCGQCHIAHQTLGDILVESTDGLVSTLCLSCHSPGGWVPMSKELSPAEIANPGVPRSMTSSERPRAPRSRSPPVRTWR